MKFLRGYLMILFSWLLPATAAWAQRVEVVGMAASFNASQSRVRESDIQLGNYLLQTTPAYPRFDDTGNRFSAYARIRVGEGSFFVQPELAYTNVLSSRYLLNYPGDAGSPGAPGYQPASTAPFGYRMRRGEVAALAGRHLGPRFYVLAGPVLALQVRDRATTSVPAVYHSLAEAVEPVQLLGQVGLGLKVWRLDLGLRYEQSLTPYSRQITFDEQTQGFHQRTNQFILSAGVLLYDRSHRWRK